MTTMMLRVQCDALLATARRFTGPLAPLVMLVAVASCAHLNRSQAYHAAGSAIGCELVYRLTSSERLACAPVLTYGAYRELAYTSPDWRQDAAANLAGAFVWYVGTQRPWEVWKARSAAPRQPAAKMILPKTAPMQVPTAPVTVELSRRLTNRLSEP